MDGQGNATEANSLDSGLDEVKAFSTYTGAISEITAQYKLWQEWQDDLITHTKQYGIADSLAKSIHQKLLQPTVLEQKALDDHFLSPDVTQRRLDEGTRLIDELKLSHQRKDVECNEKNSSIQHLKKRHRDDGQEIKKLEDSKKEAGRIKKVFLNVCLSSILIFILFSNFILFLWILGVFVGLIAVIVSFHKAFLFEGEQFSPGGFSRELIKGIDRNLSELSDRNALGDVEQGKLVD
jgi:hypothetical protein